MNSMQGRAMRRGHKVHDTVVQSVLGIRSFHLIFFLQRIGHELKAVVATYSEDPRLRARDV